MGKGDKKSKRGKIVNGSYGVRRPKKKNKKALVATPSEKTEKKPAKKTTAKKK